PRKRNAPASPSRAMPGGGVWPTRRARPPAAARPAARPPARPARSVRPPPPPPGRAGIAPAAARARARYGDDRRFARGAVRGRRPAGEGAPPVRRGVAAGGAGGARPVSRWEQPDGFEPSPSSYAQALREVLAGRRRIRIAGPD